jgi:hypothetical protein
MTDHHLTREQIEQQLQEHSPNTIVHAHEDGTSVDPRDPENLSCDFCNVQPAPHTLYAKMVKIDDTILGEGVSTGDWAACHRCYALIVVRDWESLLRYTTKLARKTFPEVPADELRKSFQKIQRAFQKAWTGRSS